jgi:hypothetical protein
MEPAGGDTGEIDPLEALLAEQELDEAVPLNEGSAPVSK